MSAKFVPSAIAAVVVFVLTTSGLHAQRSLAQVGGGTAGSGGITPRLWANMTPRPGESGFAFRVDRGRGGAFGSVLLSLGAANIELGGLRLLVDPGSVIFAPSFLLSGSGAGAGSASQALPLPADPALLGFDLWAQALVVDAAGGFVGIAASPALRVTPKASGLLIATRSIGGSTDPVDAIDLNSGTIADINAGAVDNGNGVALTTDGSRVAICSGMTDTVAFYDTSVFPPALLSSSTLSHTPWSLQMHPDGMRGYVVTQGPSGSQPRVEVLVVDPTSPNFGQPHFAGGFPAGTISALDLRFSNDGGLGYLSCLGIGCVPNVTRFDATIGNASYHQAIDQVTFPGFVQAMELSRDNERLYVVSGQLGQFSEVSVIDTATMTPIDQDPGTPGVQNIGGEMSFGPTPLGRVVTALAVDPLDRFLYISVWGTAFNDAKLVRLDIDPDSPTFRSSVSYTTGLLPRAQTGAIVLSDAGDLAYFAVSGQDSVHEIATATMTQLRTFAVPASPINLALR